jgi:phosphoribosylformimino-5-aminoimidazole carboxamide ribonucleotide (ProFAR) isomerase
LYQLSRIENVEGAIVGRALYDGTIDVRSPDQWTIST